MMRRRRVIGVQLLAALGGSAALLLHAPPAHAPGYLAIGDQVFGATIPKALATDEIVDAYAYSPDGNWIAYISNDLAKSYLIQGVVPDAKTPESTHLVVIPANGGAKRVLLSLPVKDAPTQLLFGYRVAWSSDSIWVAAAVSPLQPGPGEPQGRVVLVNVRTGEQRWIESQVMEPWFDWHPKGLGFLICDSEEVPMETPTGRGRRVVAGLALYRMGTGERQFIGEIGQLSFFNRTGFWKADGSAIVFAAFRFVSGQGTRLVRSKVDFATMTTTIEDLGGLAARSTNDPEAWLSPDWTREARWRQPASGGQELVVVDLATNKAEVVARTWGAWEVMRQAQWSPDGKFLLYALRAPLRDTLRNTEFAQVVVYWVYSLHTTPPPTGPRRSAARWVFCVEISIPSAGVGA